MFKNCAIVLVKCDLLSQNMDIGLFGFGVCDILVVAADENFASVDDVMKKWQASCVAKSSYSLNVYLSCASLKLLEKVLMICSLAYFWETSG